MSKNIQKSPKQNGAVAPRSCPTAENASACLRPIRLVDGEGPAEFAAYEEALRHALRPNGFMEEVWFRDALIAAWEMWRYERTKTALIQSGRRQAVEELLLEYLELDGRPADRSDKCKFLSLGWSAGNDDFAPVIEQELGQHGIDMDAIMARAMALKLDEIQQIDKLMSAAETRRDKALKNIERHRDGLERRRDRISDADFEELNTAE